MKLNSAVVDDGLVFASVGNWIGINSDSLVLCTGAGAAATNGKGCCEVACCGILVSRTLLSGGLSIAEIPLIAHGLVRRIGGRGVGEVG